MIQTLLFHLFQNFVLIIQVTIGEVTVVLLILLFFKLFVTKFNSLVILILNKIFITTKKQEEEEKEEEEDQAILEYIEESIKRPFVIGLYTCTSEHRSMYSYVRLSIDRCTARTSEHRSMYSYVRLSIDRCTATYV